MNGFSAADMSTAAANGHAEGYQAGYADAVKAVEAGKDAAAQEAVGWQVFNSVLAAWQDATKSQYESRKAHYPDEARELFAAPVAAAPVDGLHLAVIGRTHFGNPIPQEWYAAARELLASTPAAPGIDPADPWRGLYAPARMPKLDGVNDWIAAHPDLPQWPDDEERGIDNLIKAQGFAYAVVGDEYPDEDEAVELDPCAWLANWKPEPPAGEHWRLVMIQDNEDGPAAVFVRPLALIDASPKGGSSDALEALAIAYTHLDVQSMRVSHCNDLAKIQAALQATSAEVEA